jgi:hypothetical protein
MRRIHRAVVLLGSALVVPLALAACSSSSNSASCGSNSTITVKGGTITYAPQTNVLQTAGVTTTAVSPATIVNGALQLPISGGTFNNSSFTGSINTKGGVAFSGPGGRSVSVTNLSVNTQNGVISGQVNGQQVQLVQLGGNPTVYTGLVRGTLSTIKSSNRINNPPLPSTVVAAGGSALNQALAVGTFAPDAQIGTFSSTITYSC